MLHSAFTHITEIIRRTGFDLPTERHTARNSSIINSALRFLSFSQRRELCTLARFSSHQLIELCMLRKFVGKRHEAGADLDQSVSGVHIGDIGKLGVRDVQQLRKLQSVRRCLIVRTPFALR